MKRLAFFRVGILTASSLATAIGPLVLIGHGAYCQPAGDTTDKAVEAVTQKLRNLDPTAANAADLINQGRQIFRFDTFGDETFWGDVLNLHLAIEGPDSAALVRASAQRVRSRGAEKWI
jgi:hypothetical protein